MEQHNNENGYPRASNLRPPSKIPAAAGRLYEISDSDTNTRAQTMMPPAFPSIANILKHKPSNLPEPAPKRKTLAERAGEVDRASAAAPPHSRPVNGSVRALAAAGVRSQTSSQASNARTVSNASSNSSRITSGSSGYSGSVGSGARPPSSNSTCRPNSSMSHNLRAGSRAGIRPPSSVEHQIVGIDQFYPDQQNSWDPASRFEQIEQNMKQLFDMKGSMNQAISDNSTLQEQMNLHKTRISELDSIRSQLSSTNHSLHTTNNNLETRNSGLQITNDSLQAQVEDTKSRLHKAQADVEESKRQHKYELDDVTRKHRNQTEDLQDELRRANDRLRREAEEETGRSQRAHRDALAELEQRLRAEIEDEKDRRLREVQQLEKQLSSHRESAESEGANKDRELQQLRSDISRLQADVEQERSLKDGLKAKLTESSTANSGLESTLQALQDKIHFLESDSQAQSTEFATLKRREQEAIAVCEEAQSKLRQEETLRRKLHNQVQELKGNIRVFCRMRPTLPTDGEGEESEPAKISFPDSDTDSKEVLVMGPEQKSALGNVTTSKNPFAFDRAFGPESHNGDVFDEISQLVQSALDGYNVCIFCYGQTGSGKTYTMSSETNGMIPLAVQQIFSTASSLEEKGWTYTMGGSFVEVYNEKLNDLLGSSEDLDKKKLEIKHDDAKCRTTITNVENMTLDSPQMLETLLKKAAKNRSVAATKANERSSRSHSVFILRLTGSNNITGEHSSGTLNLVDLAGSERLAHSGATGERLKETQSINKSLSCLGDVIGALGSGKENTHIPYRNSKLTYLLQHSLGGNSKTLMFVMVSPLMAHLNETITSLRFATKVHNTHIGTAKRQARVKDS